MHETMILPVWRRAQEFAASVHAASARMPSRASGQRVTMRCAASGLVSTLGESAAATSSTQCARFLQLAVNATGDLERHFDQARHDRVVPITMVTPLQVELTVVRRMLIAARRRVMDLTVVS